MTPHPTYIYIYIYIYIIYNVKTDLTSEDLLKKYHGDEKLVDGLIASKDPMENVLMFFF